MNYLWKVVRTIMVIVGGFLVYGGISTSDYYTLELGEPEPSSVWTTIIVGLILLVPPLIHAVYVEIKKGE